MYEIPSVLNLITAFLANFSVDELVDRSNR